MYVVVTGEQVAVATILLLLVSMRSSSFVFTIVMGYVILSPVRNAKFESVPCGMYAKSATSVTSRTHMEPVWLPLEPL
eukprot:5283213-Pleurochrysis_carterae.AAC.1